jgi:hypothetical protein
LKPTYYIFSYTKFLKIWYAIYYKLNEVHDGFIMIPEKVLNLISYIYF